MLKRRVDKKSNMKRERVKKKQREKMRQHREEEMLK